MSKTSKAKNWFGSLEPWAKAFLIIAGLFVLLFIVSTFIVCYNRRFRLWGYRYKSRKTSTSSAPPLLAHHPSRPHKSSVTTTRSVPSTSSIDESRSLRNMRTWDQSGTSFLAPGSASHGDPRVHSGGESGRTSRASTVCVQDGWGPGMAQARELEAVIEAQLSPSRYEEESLHVGHHGWMSTDGYQAVRRPEEVRFEHSEGRQDFGRRESGSGQDINNSSEYGYGRAYDGVNGEDHAFGGRYADGNAINSINDAERGYEYRVEAR